MEVAVQIASAVRNGQDRAVWFPIAGGHLLVVADGAGGTSGGAEAAEAVVAHIRALPEDAATDWARVLRELDARLATGTIGETTAVVACVASAGVIGASVGDSVAWALSPSGIVDLTSAQRRKPLIGSGAAVPMPFGPVPVTSRLLLASDGLVKYARPERIHELALGRSVSEAVRQLVDAARLPSGALQDDIAVVLAG